MSANLDVKSKLELLYEADERKLDFNPEGLSMTYDFAGWRETWTDALVKLWGPRCRQEGFHSDAQLGTVVACALTAIQEGFYLKSALAAKWSDGTLLTLTDGGVKPGHRKIQTTTHGAFARPMNKGVVAPGELPERAVQVGQSTYEQTYHDVMDMAYVTVQEMAEASLQGYSAMEAKGEILRRQHDQNLNDLIREGLPNLGLDGILTHPGVRQRAAQFDWGTADSDDIWDEWRAFTRTMSNSPTQDGEPTDVVLPPVQHDNIMGEQFSPGGTDTTLGQWIMANKPIKIHMDYGMKSAVSGSPGAVYYFNERRLIRVTMPYWLNMLPPFDLDPKKTMLLVESRFAGVQIQDVDKVLVIDGGPAGWAAED
jgi:hypothetical protein